MLFRQLKHTALALGILASAAGAQARPPLTPDTPVPIDPALTAGTLENGLTYYIRENSRPEDRADLWLVVNAGSVLEEEDQRGLAHLLEHMAFNGTRNFAKQELVDYLESIGMQFGPSINAFTSFDETVYQLHVPTDDAEILETGFQILEDWAHGITLDPEEVDKERGVVIEEWRLGLGAGSRIRDQQLPVMFANSRYAERLPIGDPEVLRTFEHESLERFYREWYRPELMAVVAVGDFDAARIEELVREHFSRVEARPDAPFRPYYEVPRHEEPLFAVATDPELTGSQAGVVFKQEGRARGTGADDRRGLVQSLFDSMLNQRLFEITQKPDAPFLAAFSGQGSFVRTLEVYQLMAAVQETGIETGLEALLREAERIARHGFTRTELERQKTEMLRGLEQAYAERANRNSRGYASEYQRVYLAGESTPGIEWEYRVAEALLGTVTLEEVNRMARLNITEENRVILVSAPEKAGVEVPDERTLEAVFERVENSTVEPYVDEAADATLMEEIPQPGSIVSRDTIEEIDVTGLELSNGVRVRLKPTYSKDDEIVMRAYSPGGSSLAPDSIYDSASMAAQLMAQGGLGQFDVVQLQRVLTGVAASAGVSISELTEGMSGSASPQDMEEWFQLMHLRFTEPRKDPDAFQAFKQRVTPALTNRAAAPGTHFQDTLTAVMTQDHPRRRPPTVAWLEELDLEAAYDFYRERFADAGDFTFIFVGAFEVERVEPLVERYLASLPAIDRSEEWVDEGIRPPEGVIRKIVRKGLEPRAQTQLVFTGEFEYSQENRIALSALAQVLELRLRERMREDLGGTYSVGVRGSGQQYPYEGYQIGIGFGSDPERVPELVEVVFEEIRTLREEGAAEEDLVKVREQVRRARETSLESNTWWASELQSSDFQGLDPTRLVRTDSWDAVTRETVQRAAARWLREDRYVQVSLVPENSEVY